MFDFYTGADPTNGYVNYLNETDAEVLGLVNTHNNQVYMGVDHNTIAQAPGRSSVRIASTATYNHGLIILDLEHMPGGICGTWPAFWLLGPNWPNGGEIDIIENANAATTNQMTLHTNAGCTITNNGLSRGTILGTNCDVAATSNAGCSIATPNTATYGSGFNTANGGIYATEWTSAAISIWFFPRSSIPADITSGTPDPSNWGLPLAEFSGGCDIDAHFEDQQIVFDTTFCGDWAGAVWSADPVCSKKADTCVDYVRDNPADFADAYWAVNGLKVYQENGAAATTSSVGVGSSLTVTSTSFIATTTFAPSFVPTTFATSTLASFSNTFFTSISTSLSNAFPTSTTTSFSNTFATSMTTSFSTTPPTSSTTSFSTTPPASTAATSSNTFFTTSSTFSTSFSTPPPTPTSFSTSFTPPTSTSPSTPTVTPTFPATTPSWTQPSGAPGWSASWTQPTGTSSWSSWGGGQGGQGGENGGGWNGGHW